MKGRASSKLRILRTVAGSSQLANFKISPGLGRYFPGATAIAIATHMHKMRKEIKPAGEALRNGARRVLEVLEAAIAGYLRERQIHAFARLFTS